MAVILTLLRLLVSLLDFNADLQSFFIADEVADLGDGNAVAPPKQPFGGLRVRAAEFGHMQLALAVGDGELVAVGAGFLAGSDVLAEPEAGALGRYYTVFKPARGKWVAVQFQFKP